MTLKEKLNDRIITNIDIRESENRMYYEYNHLELAEECEKVADEFAIGFAEWFNNLKYDVMRYKTMEEHLEIYKKEKGL